MNWDTLLPQLGGALGIGLGAMGANNTYSNYMSGFGQMTPTQLGNFSMSSPTGVGSYNLGAGTGQIGYGALSPTFNGLAGLTSAGVGGYNSSLIPGLTTSAYGTLNPALSTLNSAYSGNNLYQQEAATQAGSLGQTYNDIYGNTLAAMRAQAAPAEQQAAYGLQNTLFGNGVAGSTGGASGSLMAANFGRGLAQADASRQLAAEQAAQSGMSTQAGVAGELANTGNGLLTNAFQNFGNTNQLISGLNTADLNNAITGIQGAGAIGSLGLNNYNAGLQTALSAAQARNGSLFSYAMGLNGMNSLANPYSVAANGLTANNGSLLNSLFGTAASGGSPGTTGLIGGLVKGAGSLYNDIFGGGGSTGGFTPMSSPADNLGSNYFNNVDTSMTQPGGMFSNSSILGTGSGFSGAGGQAATSAASSIRPYLSDANLGMNIAQGIASGTPTGYASAGLNAASLYGKMTNNPLFGTAAGYGGGLLGVYGGIKSGTPAGYANAAVDAAPLAANAAADSGLISAGTAAGIGAGASALALGPGMVYGLASLFQGLFPNQQMTSQQIAATLPKRTAASVAAQINGSPLLTTNSPGMSIYG